MKKVCFVTTVSGTLKAFVVKLACYLHEYTDWDISFICSDDQSFADFLPEYIHYYPVHMERGISLGGIKAMLAIKEICRREKFDLIQYATPNASLYASLASWLVKIPNRLYCQWGMAYVGFHGLKRKFFKAEEKLVCGLSTWIEPDSHSNLTFAHAEGLYPPRKGSVIWNGSACGVDLKKFDVLEKAAYREKIRAQYQIGKDAFVYGFVGRITRDKGINELLRCAQRLFRENRDIWLLIVGREEVDDSVDQELYRWSKACGRVIYAGYTDAVEQYLSAMDVYMLPSYREGFGMGVIEAEAMGVPVIVSDIPGPADAMLDGETGVVVKKAHAQSLYEAMKYLLENRQIRESFGLAGSRFARENFEQEALFEQILEDRKRLLKVDEESSVIV